MRRTSILVLFSVFFSGLATAQPPGITFEMIMRSLPLEGAPEAIAGPYEVVVEEAFGNPRYVIYRPANMAPFPENDTLPVLSWGNSGCAIDGTRLAGFLETIASHGFVALNTVPLEGDDGRRQIASDLVTAIDVIEAENKRSGSPLSGKVDLDNIAVMGHSCGGFISIDAGGDPRVDTIGLFGSGVESPENAPPGYPYVTTEAYENVRGPALFINGHEPDFQYEISRANFDAVNHVPAFYGARHNAGHEATMTHPGGGEYANVASSWLKYQLKGDQDAGRMFLGEDCELCTNPNWETDSSKME